MKKIFIFSTLVLSCVLLGHSAAIACSCDLPHPVKDARRESQAVFSGKVLEIVEGKMADDQPAGFVEVKFEVLRTWKGVETDKAVVYTTNICCICGYTFKVGESYLVYAYSGSKDKAKLWTNICTRTAEITDAKEDLKTLGKGAVPKGKAKAPNNKTL